MLIVIWRSNPTRFTFWYGLAIGDDDFHPMMFREIGIGCIMIDLENSQNFVWSPGAFQGHRLSLGAISIEEVGKT